MLLETYQSNEECENLKAVIDCRVLTKRLAETRSQTFYKPINVHSVANANRQDQCKDDFSCSYIFCGLVVNKL